MWKCGFVLSMFVVVIGGNILRHGLPTYAVWPGTHCIAQALLEFVVLLLPLLDFWGFGQVSPSPKGCTILNSHQYVPFTAPKCPFISALHRDSLIPFMFTFGLK